MIKRENLRGLYAITDNTLTPSDTILDQVTKALKGGAKIIQFRDKESSDEYTKTISLKLQKLCEDYDALFVLNDRANIAIELGLSGLHIGRSEYKYIPEIRRRFNGCLGISCYGDVSFAKDVERMGVDYVAFGSFFASKTKPDSELVNLEILSQAKEYLNIPICAIGGINIDNVSSIVEHNVDMVAIINDIWNSEDTEKKAREFAKFYEDKA